MLGLENEFDRECIEYQLNRFRLLRDRKEIFGPLSWLETQYDHFFDRLPELKARFLGKWALFKEINRDTNKASFSIFSSLTDACEYQEEAGLDSHILVQINPSPGDPEYCEDIGLEPIN